MVCAMAQSWGEIIDALGGTGIVAGALGQSDSTVSSWRSRGIPSPHWAALVRLGADRDCAAVTLEILAALAAREPAEARE